VAAGVREEADLLAASTEKNDLDISFYDGFPDDHPESRFYCSGRAAGSVERELFHVEHPRKKGENAFWTLRDGGRKHHCANGRTPSSFLWKKNS